MQGTILPGITRASVIELAKRRGYTVEETAVEVTEAMDADEVLTTGTAVVLCSVGSLTYKVGRYLLHLQSVYSTLTRDFVAFVGIISIF